MRRASSGDITVYAEPVLLVRWRELAHTTAGRVAKSRLRFEGGVCFEETIVNRSAVAIEQHFDDAKALIDGVKQRSVMSVGRCVMTVRHVGDVRSGSDQFMGQLASRRSDTISICGGSKNLSSTAR